MDPQGNNQNGVIPGQSQQDPGVVSGVNVAQDYVTNVTQDYRVESLDNSLEVHTPQQAQVFQSAPKRPFLYSTFFSRRKATIVSTLITATVLLLTIGAMSFLVRRSPNDKQQNAQTSEQKDVKIEGAINSDIPKELQGAEQSLLVNGDVVTRGSLKVSSGGYVTVIRVQDPKANQTVTLPGGSGTICLDTGNCSYATKQSVVDLQTRLGSLNGDGTLCRDTNNCEYTDQETTADLQSQLDQLQNTVALLGQVTIPPAGVTDLNAQTGSVNIQGSVNRVIVSTSGGTVTISTPQDLDANANVQFGNLTLSQSGQIRANTLIQTSAGNNVSINAGNDMITFVSGGKVFQLPTTGGANQTICTTGATCATGSGTAVVLSPGTAQVDGTTDASIFINDTGGGNLIQMQSGGTDKFTVSNAGNTTIGGTLTVATLGNGFVKSSSGTLNVVSAINLTSDVSGTLPLNNGGTNSTTAAGARSNLGAAASGANGDITNTTALNTITPSGALTVGSSSQQFTLQGASNSSISAGSGANITTINFIAPTGIHTISFPAVSSNATVCVSTGNCTAGGSAGGDLTGSYPNPTVAKLQGSDLNITSAASGQILVYNGATSRWENAAVSGDITLSGTGVATIANNAVTTAKIANSNVTNAKLQNSSVTVTAGNGLSGGGAVSLGASTNLAVVYGSAANTAVQGNTAITITAGTGLSGGGSITLGSGGSSTLNVAYGSSASTAVQGNTQLTCAGGIGNLSGGGTVITLGAGGTCGSLSITNSPVFSGTLAVQGATTTIGASGQQGSLLLYDGGSGVAAHTGTVQVIGTLAQNTTYILPDPTGASATICLSTGNCAGSGGGVTSPGGNSGKIAKFTGTNTIADSTLSESGTTVTATGNVVIQGSNSLSLGTASSLDGSVRFYTSAGANYVALQAPTVNPGSNLTFKLPSSYGSNGDCVKSDGTGGLTITACTGGSGGGVTSVAGQTGVVTISNASGSSGNIVIDDATTVAKGIASFSSSNFSVSTGAVSIKSGGVGTTEIADGSVTGTDIASGTVANSNLANSSVTVNSGTNLTGGGAVSLGGNVTLNVTNSPSFSGSLSVTGASNLDGGATIRGLTVNTATATDDQILISVAATGSNRFSGTITNADLTANQTYTLPNASGTVCLNSGNCAGAGSGVTASTPGTATRLAVFAGTQDITSSWLAQNSSTLELDNTRNLSLLGGNLSANGTITGTQLVSSVTTGTAPLTVASTTLVSNFNADLLDGQEGSFYQDAGNLNAGTVASARLSGSYTGITGVGTITAGTWNGTAIADAYLQDNITISNLGTVDWTALNNYPAACSAGQAITQLNDSITCTTFAAGSGSGNYIQNQNSTDQTADFRISGTGRANTGLQTPLLDTASAVDLNIGTTNAVTINLNKHVVVAAGQSLTITGGDTTSRNALATAEGKLYYDTTTKQLMIYSNGKWQADRNDAVLVAATDSSNADKAAADYIADGTDDQVEINNALTAASSSGSRKTGKVYLFAGTYTTHQTNNGDATIKVPNNVTLAGSGTGTLIKLGDIDATDNLIENTDTSTGTGVTIRDMKLDGQRTLNTAGTERGINLNGMGSGTGSSARQGALVEDVIVTSFRSENIYLTNSSNNKIANVTAQDSGSEGLQLTSSSSYNLITGSKFQGNAGSGVLANSSSASNTISSNNSQGNTSAGFSILAANNTLSSNVSNGNAYGFFLSTGATGTTVTGNTMQGNTSSGVTLSVTGNTYNTITSNTVIGGTNGLDIDGANNTVTGNTVQGNTFGIAVTSDESTITGNTVISSTTYGIIVNAANNNAVSGNKIYNSGGGAANNGIYLTAADSNSITGNNVTDTSATGTNYAINISGSTSDTNYIANNTLGTGSINDAGTGTIYGGQTNSSGNLMLQPAGTIELMKNTNVTGTLSATTLTSTVATGTAPLTVSSTTVVANLNADLLDGQHGSYYQDAGNINAGTLAVSRGGTGAGTFTQYGVLFGNGTSAFGVTAAGSTGQCLLATTSAAPSWGSCTATDLPGAYAATATTSGAAEITLADAKGLRIIAADTTTDPSIIMKLSCVACATGTAGNFLIQNASSNALLSVAGDGTIEIGSANNGIYLAGTSGSSSGSFTLKGTARNSKKIRLLAEYPSVVLTPDGSNNTGTMTSGYDNTSSARMNYYNWTTTQVTNQDYDIVVQVPLPSDFDGWDGSNPLSITSYTTNTTNGTILLEARDSNDTQICNFVSVTPGSTSTWTANTTACTLSTGTYTPGDYITLRIRLQAPTSGNTRVGNIVLSYKSKF